MASPSLPPPAAPSAPSAADDGDRKIISVYENQRKNLMGSKGFTASNLYGYERPEWSDADGAPLRRDDPLIVPGGWMWEPKSEWCVPKGQPGTDAEAWQYGGMMWPEAAADWTDAEHGRHTLVRRRKWERPAVRARRAGPDGADMSLTRTTTQKELDALRMTVVQDDEKVVAQCEAGFTSARSNDAVDGVVMLTDQRLIWKVSEPDVEGAEPEPEAELSTSSGGAVRWPAGPGEEGRVVIEVVQAWGLPPTSSWQNPERHTGGARLDPYTQMRLIDMSDPQQKLRGEGRTQTRRECNEPVWRNYVELGTCSNEQAMVSIEIYDDATLVQDTKMAEGHVRLADLPCGQVRTLGLEPVDSSAAQDKPVFRCQLLDGDGTPWTHGIDPRQSQSAPGRGEFKPIIQIRRLDPDLSPARCRMTLILVRHGESEWNEAKAQHRFDVMASSVDHPLNSKGVLQARRVHRGWASSSSATPPGAGGLAAPGAEPEPEPAAAGLTSFGDISLRDSVAPQANLAVHSSDDADSEAFRVYQIRKARRMYSSPLTRAVQTGILAFEGHPCVAPRELGMTLLCSAREVKNLGAQNHATLDVRTSVPDLTQRVTGGFDTVGEAMGDDIPRRAMEKMSKHLPKGQDVEIENLDAVHLDLEEVNSKWWTDVTSVDTSETLQRRIHELLDRVRYDAEVVQPDDDSVQAESSSGLPCLHTAIVVCHSIIIREIVRRCTVPGTDFDRSLLGSQLSGGKINNGGVIALDLEFLPNRDTRSEEQPASIQKAELLFGTQVENRGASHSAIPLHALVRIEESGLMSPFQLKLKFRATTDGVGTSDGGHIGLGFAHRLERDKLLAKLTELCAATQARLLRDSLAVDEPEVVRQPCESCRPSKSACGETLHGVRGGDGGEVLLTVKRLIWIPSPTRTEDALRADAAALTSTIDLGGGEGEGQTEESAAVLSVELSTVSYVEVLATRSMSNLMGFSSPGLKIKLRAPQTLHLCPVSF